MTNRFFAADEFGNFAFADTLEEAEQKGMELIDALDDDDEEPIIVRIGETREILTARMKRIIDKEIIAL